MNDKQPKCEWPYDCKDDAWYLVRFYIPETGKFSREMAFCPKHFAAYQVEERKA